ncbi:hypothetical protein [Pseudanabaena sp. 'Roaring Creek']|uniref:hypothetical protein n=1 Tax=Pseudanabaena sp. 'Roaring Creek' TaxID=1681830 RepID=UPI0006D7B6C0|nr:hypothetical protein [Pseudanabaena sp. 'Roaring Creek']
MHEVLEQGRSGIEIMLRDEDGNLLPASIDTGSRDWTDTDGRHTDCLIKLSWAGGVIEETDWNYFASFKKVRKRLATHSLLPMCYGASRRVILTGMAVDMGLGQKIWRVNQDDEMYHPLVGIFKTGEDVEPVSVEEQEKFQAEWWKRKQEQLAQQNNPDAIG